jgi:membrane protein YqaA with SNARE-associated domain
MKKEFFLNLTRVIEANPKIYLSWVPVIGDPITLIAGLLKENFVRFVVMVSIAKIGRYLFVYWMFSQF